MTVPMKSPSEDTSRPLDGKTVLITRAREQAAEFALLLEQAGAEVVLFPTVEICEPDDWTACDLAIRNLKKFDGLIFTSSNAIHAFFKRVMAVSPASLSELSGFPSYVVGSSTAATAQKYSLKVLHWPEVIDARSLASSIAESQIAGRNFLIPKGTLAGDEIENILQGANASVTSAYVYQTIQPSESTHDFFRQITANQDINVLTFFSPSSVLNFFKLISPTLLTKAKIAVIGSTTAAAVRDLGLSVDMQAEEHSSASFAKTIIRFYQELR